jgi:outer membrane protein
MMRTLIRALFGISLLLAALGLAHAQDIKIGFVNAARVLEEAPQAGQARENLEKEFAPRDKKLLADQKEMKKLEEKLTRDGAIMSESERVKLERDIISRKRDLKRGQDEFREDLNIRRNEAFEKLRRDVFEVVVAISKEENFDLIVSDGVVYASDRIDITDMIIRRLEEEFKKAPKAGAK